MLCVITRMSMAVLHVRDASLDLEESVFMIVLVLFRVIMDWRNVQIMYLGVLLSVMGVNNLQFCIKAL